MIKASSYRRKILESVQDEIHTPSEISKITDIRLNHVSNILTELVEANLVECLNDYAKKGRLYQITELGYEIIKKA
ncbi:MAG: winged helix-turn-helix domain-containing protein [Methanosarcinaceae archaeon]|nr:winged helix-turn-helix domain-containing protein [Methanosarcinaceae archaeon]MDD4330826.1 winged helix-turn-helix domain-containing protein [Methanosarcinaceae archaeon]